MVRIKKYINKYKKEIKKNIKKKIWELGYKPLKEKKDENLPTIIKKTIRCRKSRSLEAEIENLMMESGLFNKSGEYAMHIETVRDKDNENHYTTYWKLPRSLTFKQYMDKKDNFANSLTAQVIIEPRNGLLMIDVYKGIIPKKVNYKFNYLDYADKYILPVILGKNQMGNIIWDLEKVQHCLISGSTGTGKSILTTGWADALLQNPNVLIFVIDLAMTDFIHLSNHVMFTGDIEGARKILDLLWEELIRRLKILTHFSVRTITDLNKKFPQYKLPYLILFIDEFAFTAPGKFHNKEEKKLLHYLQKKIQDIAQLGRKCGLRLIISMQRPDRELISPIIKNNLVGRISFKTGDKGHSLTILGNTDAFYLPDIDGRLLALYKNKQIEAQALYLDPDIAIERMSMFGSHSEAYAKYFYGKDDIYVREQYQIYEHKKKRLLPR